MSLPPEGRWILATHEKRTQHTRAQPGDPQTSAEMGHDGTLGGSRVQGF